MVGINAAERGCATGKQVVKKWVAGLVVGGVGDRRLKGVGGKGGPVQIGNYVGWRVMGARRDVWCCYLLRLRRRKNDTVSDMARNRRVTCGPAYLLYLPCTYTTQYVHAACQYMRLCGHPSGLSACPPSTHCHHPAHSPAHSPAHGCLRN